MGNPDRPDFSNNSEVQEYLAKNRALHDHIFIEIQFYFVAWTNCQNMMKTISSLPEFEEVRIYYHAVRKHFDSYSEARNTFEHFHDRLPGGKNQNKVKEIQEEGAGPRKVFGGLSKGTYTFSDRSWDITPQSYQILEECVTEFLNQIHSVVNELHKVKTGNA